MEKRIISGEELAWQRLNSLDPEEVCKKAVASYNSDDKTYTIKCLGKDFIIFPEQRKALGVDENAQAMLDRLSYFFKLSMLWYLIESKDIGLSGRLVSPKNISGGDIFFKGTHVLPLEGLADIYKNNTIGFIAKGTALGGTTSTEGDAALTLLPFPRVPVRLILWDADEEFNASADFLFDSTCEMHLPLDVIWSTAMFTLIAMMK